MKLNMLLVNLLGITLLSGCAAVGSFQVSDKTLKQKTAKTLKTKASKVKISKRRRSADVDTLRINVKANGKRYRCYYTVDYTGKVSDTRCKKRKPKKKKS